MIDLLEAVPELATQYRLDQITKIAIISVNAHSSPDKGWELRRSPPGMIDLAVASSSIPIDRYSAETVALVEDRIKNLRDRAPAGGHRGGEVSFYFSVLSFQGVSDPVERRYFMEQPTSFHLRPEAVARLREIGGRLLRESKPFQELLRDLGGASESRWPRYSR